MPSRPFVALTPMKRPPRKYSYFALRRDMVPDLLIYIFPIIKLNIEFHKRLLHQLQSAASDHVGLTCMRAGRTALSAGESQDLMYRLRDVDRRAGNDKEFQCRAKPYGTGVVSSYNRALSSQTNRT